METILELKNVTKIFGKGRLAVRAVESASLAVKKGEVVLLMGPSGSGKTTLLSMAGLLLRPTSGEILIKRKEVSALEDKKLSQIRLKSLGFIFQAFNLLQALSALENVEFVLNLAGQKGEGARSKAKRILERLGLGKRLSHLPSKLSGGEQQRVAIARALVLDPDLILADEPTGNLDSKIGHEVISLLCKIACDEGRSVIVASHDARLRDIADRIILMEDGKIKSEEEVRYESHDPVCGMKVDRAQFKMRYSGKIYYFCSQDCLDKFKGNPLSYVRGEVKNL